MLDLLSAANVYLLLPIVYKIVGAVVALHVAVLFTVWGWYAWFHWRILVSAWSVPTGRPTLPLVGHIHYIFLHGYSGIVDWLTQLAQENSLKNIKTLCLWVGPSPTFLISGEDDIQTIMLSSKTTEKHWTFNVAKIYLGNGLLTAPDHIQKKTRRFLNPIFQPRNIQQLAPMFNKTASQLVMDLSQHVGEGHVNVKGLADEAALKSISYAIFRPEINIDSKNKEAQILLSTISRCERNMNVRVFKWWEWPDVVFDILHWRENRQGEAAFKRFAEKYTQKEEKPKHADSEELGLLSESKEIPTVKGAYDKMRKIYPEITEQDLQFEYRTLFGTGVHTSAIAIASCLLALAAHQEVQERLYREVVNVVGPSIKDVTLEDINEMPYLDQVVKETLRWSNVVTVFYRAAKEDIQLKDCVIPAGSNIAICIAGLHWDSAAFPDPTKFDPQHFSPENTANLNRLSYMPFSSGSRNCIGGLYAITLIKYIVVHVIRRFWLTTKVDVTSMKFDVRIVRCSRDGYFLEIHDRL